MKNYLFALLFLLACLHSNGQNLIDSSNWQLGAMPPTGFTVAHNNLAENSFEEGENPFGETAVLWKGINASDNDGTPDGGFRTAVIDIDPNKTYRISTWIKKTVSEVGTIYYTVYARDDAGANVILKLNNTETSNPLAFYRDEGMNLGDWYLFVAYVHPQNYDSTTKLGGVYNGNSGELLRIAANDFKFSSTATKLQIYPYAYGADPGFGSTIFFYNPRIEEVNGSEPSLENLLSGNTNTTTDPDPVAGTSLWSESNGSISYTNGAVKIGTTAPDADYLLTVNGKMHAKELKVDLEGALAPDYVFYEDYNLRTLVEVQEHINTNGHLPNIPSAASMEEEGINLKEMNLKLLEKIEELTLYTIDQEKRIAILEKLIKAKK